MDKENNVQFESENQNDCRAPTPPSHHVAPVRRSQSLYFPDRKHKLHHRRKLTGQAPPSTPEKDELGTLGYHRKLTSVGNVFRAWDTFRSNWLTSNRSETKDSTDEPTRQNSQVSDLYKNATEFKKDATGFVRADSQRLLHEMRSDRHHGLRQSDAEDLLMKYGPNEIVGGESDPLWKIFLLQFHDPLIYMLLTATVVALVTKELELAVAILAIVFLNAVVGTVQNHKADHAIRALKETSQPTANVRRAGDLQKLEKRDIVPGDIIVVRSGDVMAADGILLSSDAVAFDEKNLTGEQVPVNKTRIKPDLVPADNPEAYASALMKNRYISGGTVCVTGSAEVLVVQTGMNSAQGRIAGLILGALTGKSPLKEQLEQLGVRLGIYSFGISVVIFVAGILLGQSLLTMTLVAIAVTVAAVPESLPVIITMGLTRGMRRMAKLHKVQIRNLASVETFGSCSVICTDKTGTLTTSRMTTKHLWTCTQAYFFSGEGWNYTSGQMVEDEKVPVLIRQACEKGDSQKKAYASPVQQCLQTMALCSNATTFVDPETHQWTGEGHMTERALYAAARKCGVCRDEARFERLVVHDFTSARKMMSVVYRLTDQPGLHIFVKGGPNVLLSQCTHVAVGSRIEELTPELQQVIMDANDRYCEQGERVLALAYKHLHDHGSALADHPLSETEVEAGLVFLGLVGSLDPPRPEVAPALIKAAAAGVRTIMITGDYRKTAQSIAQQIGLVTPEDDSQAVVIDCAQFRAASHRERVLMCLHVKAFARAVPADKQDIVTILQSMHHVVAMTGDGVNDAPALKQADIGIGMGLTGSDVANQTADAVLTDDNFASIVAGIEEARSIYTNLGLAIALLLTTNVAEVFLILIAVLMKLASPLLPGQLLWLNLTTDASPALAMNLEPADPDNMKQKPRHRKAGMINSLMKRAICYHNVVLTVVCLFAYFYGLYEATGDWFFSPTNKTEEHEIKLARTIVFYVIEFAELLRGLTSRSLTKSIFRLGFTSNMGALYAFLLSGISTLVVGHTPGIMDIFELEYLNAEQWTVIVVLSFIPAVMDELWKVFITYCHIAPPETFHQPCSLIDLPRKALQDPNVEHEHDSMGSLGVELVVAASSGVDTLPV